MEQITNTEAALQPGIAEKFNGLLAKRPVIMQLLRFAAIGVINTALDFLVLNLLTKNLGITSGVRLGQINVIGFSLAVIQSYFWNRYWTFNADQVVSLWKNFTRLVLVGSLGALAVLLVLLGANIAARPGYYMILLLVFLVAQVALWLAFGFSRNGAGGSGQQFAAFLVVSLVGLAINSLVIAVVSQRFALVGNADLNKNIAKILATLVSLTWNFVGYKILVFKK